MTSLPCEHTVSWRLVILLPLRTIQNNLSVISSLMCLERLLNIARIHAIPPTLQSVVLGAWALRVHKLVIAGPWCQLNHLLVVFHVEAQGALIVPSCFSLILADKVLLGAWFWQCLLDLKVESCVLFGVAHCELGDALFSLVKVDIVWCDTFFGHCGCSTPEMT